MKYILGLDQGASTTKAIIATQAGEAIGVGQAAGASHVYSGMEHALKMMQEATRKAFESAGLEKSAPIAIGAGVTGADFDYEYDLLRQAVSKEFGVKTTIINDCVGALRAETAQRNTLIICAGSGLNIGLRSLEGDDVVLGYAIDDSYQGGFGIARAALRAVFEADSGIAPRTVLETKILDFYNCKTVNELMQGWYVGGVDKNRLKSFAIEVDLSAGEGDEVALAILYKFAKGCAYYSVGGMKRYNMLASSPQIILSGSIFKSTTTLLEETIAAQIHKQSPSAVISSASLEPVVGGLVVALETMQEKPISTEQYETIAQSALELGQAYSE